MYIVNLDYWDYPNIKTLYKNNPNTKICVEKNLSLLRNFLKKRKHCNQ